VLQTPVAAESWHENDSRAKVTGHKQTNNTSRGSIGEHWFSLDQPDFSMFVVTEVLEL